MQLQEKLLQQQTTPDPSSQYFIDRYNIVIDTYNKLQSEGVGKNNNTGKKQLSELHGNCLKLGYLDGSDSIFRKFYQLFGRSWVKVGLVIVLMFLPVVNLVVYGAFWFYFLFLKRQGKKHSQNLKITKDPLHKFYFLPQICHQLSKHCTTIQIRPEQLTDFTFNTSLLEQIRSCQKQRGSLLTDEGSTNNGEPITVTIYDQYFYDSFHLVRKEQYRVGVWIVLATLLVTADVFFYLMLGDAV